MSVGMAFLVFLVVIAAVVVSVAVIANVVGGRQELSRAQKTELVNLRRLVKEINADAHRYQELEPNFTSTVIDKVSNHYQKELES